MNRQVLKLMHGPLFASGWIIAMLLFTTVAVAFGNRAIPA